MLKYVKPLIVEPKLLVASSYINAMGVQEVIRLTISNKRASGVVLSLFYCYPKSSWLNFDIVLLLHISTLS
jgi:hypothetical protein